MKITLPNVKNYKTQNEYIDAVYKLYKEKINKGYEGIKNKKGAFKQQIKDRLKQDSSLSLKETIKKELGREVYVSKAEKFKNNVMQGLKTYGLEKTFKSGLRDDKGRFVKFDENNLNYIGDNSYEYIDNYGNHFVINFKNSPKEVQIYSMSGK